MIVVFPALSRPTTTMFTCRVMLQVHQTCACTKAACALAMCMGHGGQVAYLLANQPEEREQRVQEPTHAACGATPTYLLPKQAQLAIASGSSPHACAPSNSYGLMPSEATGADAVACSSLQPRCGGGWPAEQRFVQQQDSKEDLLWQRCYVRGIPRLTAELRGTYLGRGVNECFEQERNTQARTAIQRILPRSSQHLHLALRTKGQEGTHKIRVCCSCEQDTDTSSSGVDGVRQ